MFLDDSEFCFVLFFRFSIGYLIFSLFVFRFDLHERSGYLYY